LLLHVENKNEINKSSLYKKNILKTHEERRKDKKKTFEEVKEKVHEGDGTS
jgi:hypothetical protein